MFRTRMGHSCDFSGLTVFSDAARIWYIVILDLVFVSCLFNVIGMRKLLWGRGVGESRNVKKWVIWGGCSDKSAEIHNRYLDIKSLSDESGKVQKKLLGTTLRRVSQSGKEMLGRGPQASQLKWNRRFWYGFRYESAEVQKPSPLEI